jgi:isocitrate dehydrogenase (NAD+)
MAEAADRQITATLIPGDGIGSEIVEATVTILDALGTPFVWSVQQGGMAAIEQGGDPLPRATLDSIRRTRLALKGPSTHPGWRRVSVCQCVLARGVRCVRQCASGADDHPRTAIRGH